MTSFLLRHATHPVRGAFVTLLALGCAPPLQRPIAEAAAAVVQQPLALPARLSDAEFWRLTTEMSEPGGSFLSDNFVSNELTFPGIARALETHWKPGGVYIGVGPEQNFAYIAALRPRMVFLLDIRRQMVVHQLMYKALFELSGDRAEFVARLFSKPRPAGLTMDATVEEIWDAYRDVPADMDLFARNTVEVREHLTTTHGFALSEGDLRSITYVYKAFYDLGPNITYNGYNDHGTGGITFARITAQLDASGVGRSFLASEENYRIIRDLHLKNLIVPVVADFAGPTGIRSVGRYLRERNATVTAFYTSNVESYLFQAFGVADRFYANITSLPLDSITIFIRPRLSNTRVLIPIGADYATAVASLAAPPSELCPVLPFLRAQAQGRIKSYRDALSCPR
jgi:hypothetical protein